MPDEIGDLGEGFVAALPIAGIGLFLVMDSGMLLKRAVLGESL
jgi:hypothetical protein